MNNLIEFLKQQYNDKDIQRIIDGSKVNRYVSIRVNTLKADKKYVKDVLTENGIVFEEVIWYNSALIIKNKNESDIQKLDIYKDGKIYMQSLSSMLPPIIMEPQEGEDILDMTAAPGGKTTQIAAITNNLAHITALEMNAIRFERLKYNIEKQGATSVYAMQKDARNIDDFFAFDRILLDAPCSGSGTLDLQNEENYKHFTKKLVDKCVKSQTMLIEKALKILKPGKEMVYSTCSVLSEENEEIVEKALKQFNCKVVPIEFEGIDKLNLLPTKINGTICVCPDEYYEGFFVAKIQKL